MPSVREDVAFGPANLGLRAAELDRRVRERSTSRHGSLHDEPPHHLSFRRTPARRDRDGAGDAARRARARLAFVESRSCRRREVADILKRPELTTLGSPTTIPYALELCERSVIINNGSIVAEGPTIASFATASLMAATVWSCRTASTRVTWRSR